MVCVTVRSGVCRGLIGPRKRHVAVFVERAPSSPRNRLSFGLSVDSTPDPRDPVTGERALPLPCMPGAPAKVGMLVEIGRKPKTVGKDGEQRGGKQMQKHCVICKQYDVLMYTTRMCPVHNHPVCLPTAKR